MTDPELQDIITECDARILGCEGYIKTARDGISNLRRTKGDDDSPCYTRKSDELLTNFNQLIFESEALGLKYAGVKTEALKRKAQIKQ